MKKFQKELKNLALKYMPIPIAEVGEIVQTVWSDWKKSHKVKIYEIGVGLVKLHPSARTENETIFEWCEKTVGVDLYFCALRLKSDGTERDKVGSGIVLTNFTTMCGQQWQQKYDSFNHCGLSWAVSRLTSE